MTLQVVMSADDGVIVASDTRRVTSHEDESTVLTTEDGQLKIVCNQSKTALAVCAKYMRADSFLVSILDVVSPNWGKSADLIEKSTTELWREEWERDHHEGKETSLLLVHCSKPEIYRMVLFPNKSPSLIVTRKRDVRYGEHNGQVGNPAYFFPRRYSPANRTSVDSLVRLVSHYILMAGEINPFGVGGLTIFLSKNNGPFEEIPLAVIDQLRGESEQLDSATQDALLTPLSALDPPVLRFLKSAKDRE